MSWGKIIVLVFLFFAAFIGTLVVQMARQRVDLVRDDYYQDEIAYQRQIGRVRNARRLGGVFVQCPPGRKAVRVTLPPGLRTGTLTLYRPADRRQDMRLPLAPDGPPVREVSLRGRPGGLWRAQLAWTDGRLDYYTEHEILLP